MRKPLLFFLFLICSGSVYAQFSDTVHYYAGIMSSGTFNETETSSSYLLNNRLKLGVKKKYVSVNFVNAWIYGAQQQLLTNNDFNSTLNCDVYKLFPGAYYWGLVDYTSSFSLKINNQFQAGAGVAYNIIDLKHAQLNLSDGIIYENSDIYLEDSVRDVYSTCRNSLRLYCRLEKGIFAVHGTCFLQNSFLLKSDYIVKANLGLSIKVLKWFDLTVVYTYNRFNRTGRENSLLTYGLTVEKYF